MEPHSAAHAGCARHHSGVRRMGHEAADIRAPRGVDQWHASAGLRARRRAPSGRAACRRGGVARADRDHGAPSGNERARISHRSGGGIRDRSARRHLHGTRAHCAGLAFGRDARRVLRCRRRRARAAPRRRAHRARAGHRRHAGLGPDGRAVWRDGQAHARRTLVAKRALRRALRGAGLHRHPERARKRVRRLLHDVLTLAGSIRPRAADGRPGYEVADHGCRAQVLFVRWQ